MRRDAACGVGIIATSALRAELRQLAEAAGCQVVLCAGPEWLDQAGQSPTTWPQAWLLDATEPDSAQWLSRIVDQSDTPLLICDEPPPCGNTARQLWRRRLGQKLEELAAAASSVRPGGHVPAAIWVMAASTGGPRAVSEFLAALAPGLPIALVYAQHIDISFDRLLASALQRHRHYGIDLGEGEQRLLAGRVLVVPADYQLRFLPFYRVVQTRTAWARPYRPAIDQVIAQVARLYPGRCGALVFSGLCDDGALGCRVLRDKGGEVWVQRPDSCISPDMPNAVLADGGVSCQGTPAELATALNRRYQIDSPLPREIGFDSGMTGQPGQTRNASP